jgi:hypothetical protein
MAGHISQTYKQAKYRFVNFSPKAMREKKDFEINGRMLSCNLIWSTVST